ncbi:MAG: hypothetical protein KF713_17250 [Turneriella sp.]|nr:hypothetical protein [Turneriella sp.]
MRGLFERSEVLKYWLATEAQVRRLKNNRRKNGLAAVISDDFNYLIRIENLFFGWNLTPWIRRKDSIEIAVLQRLKDAAPTTLTPGEMRRFVQAARRGPAGEPVDIRVHALGDRFVVHAALNGRVAARAPQTAGELRALLTRLKLKYRNIRITLIGTDLAKATEIFRFNLEAGIVFEFERLQELRPRRERQIREVIVFTNIAGAALPQLDKQLDFWSKGASGFRFRHIFGQLTRKRVEAVLAVKEWDLLIYRGHGFVREGAIAWQLVDGAWTLPAFTCSAYMHLACLANPEELRLDRLPTARILTPLKAVEDFDDAGLVGYFIERYRASGSLISAMRAVQVLHPQFVFFSTAD